jgi:hypothetical protein
MNEVSTQLGKGAKRLLKPSLPAFLYEDGYTLSATDLGKAGVKIELSHKYNLGAAIILPPKQVGECGRWLLETLEQDSNGLPKQLAGVLERLSRQSGSRARLERGDKKKMKDALRALKRQSTRSKVVAAAEADEPALRQLSRRAV